MGRLSVSGVRFGANVRESIIAIVAGITFFSIASRANDIDHLACGNEMQSFISLWSPRNKFGEKPPHWISEKGRLMVDVHSVAMQLDEQPVRLAAYANGGLLPQFQPLQAGRLKTGQRCAVDDEGRNTVSLCKINPQRTLDNQRKDPRRAAGL